MAHLTQPQLVQLKTEITTDPTARGYAAPYTAGNDGAVAVLLNTRSAAAGTVAREPMLTQDFIEHFDQTEWNTMSTADATKLALLLSSQFVKVGNATVRGLLKALWPANGPTRAAIDALATRPASRAEVLFGAGTTVQGDDVSATRFV